MAENQPRNVNLGVSHDSQFDREDRQVSDSDSDESSDENPRAVAFITDLLRRHLKHVKLPASYSPGAQSRDSRQDRRLLRKAIAQFKGDGEVLNALLLRSALNIRKDAQSPDESEVVNGFLSFIVDDTASSYYEQIFHLYDVLGQLMRLDERGSSDGAESQTTESPGNDEASQTRDIIIHIGDRALHPAYSEILEHFWATRLDTVCEACGKDFVNEPPFRTISRVPPVDSTPDATRVRVRNRHFTCAMKLGVFFVPVSHVWHDSIREANEKRAHNDGAASELVKSLSGIFHGAETAFEEEEEEEQGNVEFWHDYFSVPQWNDDVKCALLLRLPAVYHQAPEIMVHLTDMSSEAVSYLLARPTPFSDRLNPVMTGIRLFRAVSALTTSSWSRRMWVTLEYTQCRSACIMDAANKIWRPPEPLPSGRPGDVVDRDSFTRLIVAAGSRRGPLKEVADWMSLKAVEFGQMVRRTDQNPSSDWTSECLGKLIDVINLKDCFFDRDRFLALHIIAEGLPKGWEANDGVRFPSDQVEACRWLWQKALCRGDHSPLLLQPREDVAGSDPAGRTDIPSWMAGCGTLRGVIWELGKQISSPLNLPVVDEARGAVRVDCEELGQIERIHHPDMKAESETEHFVWVVDTLIDISKRDGEELTVHELFGGLDRLFALPGSVQREIQRTTSMPSSFADFEKKNPTGRAGLANALDSFVRASGSATGQRTKQDAAEAMIDILEFRSAPVAPGLTRLSYPHINATARLRRGCLSGEPVCEVRCPSCRRCSIFRLDVRDGASLGNRVYRIPGLNYEEGLENGVGFVLDGSGRLSGRSLFGPSHCGCRNVVKVDVF